MALKADGTFWTWGWNENGQLGDGTTQNWTKPNKISMSSSAFTINDGASATNNTTVMLKMNIWDQTSGVAFMQFSNDGTAWSDAEPYATTKNWTLSDGDGVRTVYAMFQDRAGNWSSVISTSIELETQPPVVTIITPSSGFTANLTPALNYTVNQSNTQETFTLDGVVVYLTSGNNLNALAQGQHTLRIDSTNVFGNTGFAEVTFTVTNTPMTVSINSPLPGVTNNAAPLLSYSVNYGTVTVMVDGAAVGKASGDALDPLSDGAHEVRVVSTGRCRPNRLGEGGFHHRHEPAAPIDYLEIRQTGARRHIGRSVNDRRRYMAMGDDHKLKRKLLRLRERHTIPISLS